MERVLNSIVVKISSLNKGGVEHDRIGRIGAESMLAEVRERIHSKGLSADNSSIGQYSRKPIYVSLKSNVGNNKSFGQPAGKNGNTTFSSGKKHKAKYFGEGYSQFKTAIGRNQLGSVNLTLSGTMQNQLAVLPKSGGYGLGFQNAELLKRALFFEQKKYKKQIWALSIDEKELLKQIIKVEVKNAILRTNSN